MIAVIAVALAGWSLTTKGGADSTAPAEESTAATADDPAAAKTQLCDAVATVSKAVQLQTNGNLGPDPVAQTAVAANARLALLGGGTYLAGQITENAPEELADPARRFADTLQDIGMNALTGVTNQDPAQQGRLADGDGLRQQLVELCQ
ncbi:hypothetical protein [Mycolicibacterium mengxianglii]|uniref:hypothetical protein n=1 Tax=Mycolicibacterium mengxianglii TaxID=2736649 RepID=UPI0018D1B8F2|nr:hypothetical protein [Mycolicibacterium mengxianglii]